MLKKLTGAFVGLAILGIAATSNAVPLTLTYEVQDLGGGTFGYDFTLTLDNNDGSWISGQEWDWIIFGDAQLSASPLADFSWTSFDSIITFRNFSSGFHNGPTLGILASGVSLPGWEPSAIGETLQWAGTSSTFLGQGELLWSTLVLGDGAVGASFEVATKVPEPGSLALMVAGLIGLRFASKRRPLLGA